MRSASWSFPRDLSLDLAETIDTVVGNGGDVSKIRLNAARAEEERAARAGLFFLGFCSPGRQWMYRGQGENEENNLCACEVLILWRTCSVKTNVLVSCNKVKLINKRDIFQYTFTEQRDTKPLFIYLFLQYGSNTLLSYKDVDKQNNIYVDNENGSTSTIRATNEVLISEIFPFIAQSALLYHAAPKMAFNSNIAPH